MGQASKYILTYIATSILVTGCGADKGTSEPSSQPRIVATQPLPDMMPGFGQVTPTSEPLEVYRAPEEVTFRVTTIEELMDVLDLINSIQYEYGDQVNIIMAAGDYALTGKRETVSDKRADIQSPVELNVGMAVRTNASLSIRGEPTESATARIWYDGGAVDIGMLIETPGDVNISEVEIGIQESSVLPTGEMPALRSAIYIDNPDLTNPAGKVCISEVAIDGTNYGSPVESLAVSGITVRNKKELGVYSALLTGISWDGIAGFNVSELYISDSTISRHTDLLGNMGTAAAIVTAKQEPATLTVTNSSIFNFLKGTMIITAGDVNRAAAKNDRLIHNNLRVNRQAGEMPIYYIVFTYGYFYSEGSTYDNAMQFVYNANMYVVKDGFLKLVDPYQNPEAMQAYPPFPLSIAGSIINTEVTTERINKQTYPFYSFLSEHFGTENSNGNSWTSE